MVIIAQKPPWAEQQNNKQQISQYTTNIIVQKAGLHMYKEII